MSRFQFEIRTDPKGDRLYFVGGEEVTHLIRTREISSISSQIAVYPEVRKFLVQIQRRFGHSCDAVFEGRDMGTVVFPDADLKIFLTARPEVRATRRYKELLHKFPDLRESLSDKQILREMEERDHTDATRAISPLKQASESILIDTSDLSAEQVIDQIVQLQPKVKRTPVRMKRSYWIVYSLVRWFFKRFFHLQIYGVSHLRPGPGLIAANHCSFYDPPVLSISCPEEVHFLGKESLFRVPLLGRLIRILNTHPISRSATDIGTLKQVLQLLKEGKKLIIFPEGARSPDGRLQPLERGLAFLTQKSGCTVFPAYLHGTFEAWPASQKCPKLHGRMACIFGSPIEWEEFAPLPKKEAMDAMTYRCEEALRALKIWFHSGAQGTPP